MAGTPTHAIVVKVRFQPGMTDDATAVLHAEVVPGVKKAAGFVAGYWMHDADSTTGTSVELFDSLANAQAEMGRRSTEAPVDAPVTIESAEILEIVATG